jgi:hypothetical protein
MPRLRILFLLSGLFLILFPAICAFGSEPYQGGRTEADLLAEALQNVVSARDVTGEFRAKADAALQRNYFKACIVDFKAMTASLFVISDEIDIAASEITRLTPVLKKERDLQNTLWTTQTENMDRLDTATRTLATLGPQRASLDAKYATATADLAAVTRSHDTELAALRAIEKESV